MGGIFCPKKMLSNKSNGIFGGAFDAKTHKYIRVDFNNEKQKTTTKEKMVETFDLKNHLELLNHLAY